MAKQTIGVGLAANDGGGDPLRSAFVKVNENFTELYNSTATIPTALTDLGITDGTSGQVLTTDGAGAFTFSTVSGGGGGATTLGALTDVSATAPTTGQVLKWSGTQWAPGTDATASGGSGISLTDLSVAAEPSASGNGSLAYDSGTGAFTYTPPVIPADLNDLGISDGTNGQVLTTNGAGNYTFEDAPSGGGGGGSSTFSGLTEIQTADIDAHDIAVQAKTTHVMTPNGSSSYRSDIYGTADNPTIHVRAGETIAFDLTGVTGSHPFQIETAGGAAYNDGLIHIGTDGTKTTGSAAQGKTAGTLYWKVPGTISGTYKYICTVHGSMIGDIEIEAAAGASGGSGLNTRTSTNTLNSGMADGATANFDLSAAKTFVLYSIEVSDAAWVRLYIDTASRTADASRTRGNDPAPDAGVIAEVITTGSETVKFGPAVIGYCSTGNTLPCAITNDSGGTANIDVTITHLSLEA
jgi:plastocyanin